MAALFFLYVIGRCWIDPSLAPSYDLESLTFRQRLLPILVYVLPLSSLFVIVVGTMLAGVASPNEASALGAVGAFIAAALYRSLSWQAIWISLRETAKISGMILIIMCASITFSQIMTFSGATQGLLGLIGAMDVTPLLLVLALVLVLLFLGCFLDQLSMMMITLPFFMPMAQHLAVDLIWLGVIMLVMLEIGFTTPPFGLLLFVMKGVAPPDITMRQIIGSVAPFIVLALLTVGMVVAFPPLATWLPSLIQR